MLWKDAATCASQHVTHAKQADKANLQRLPFQTRLLLPWPAPYTSGGQGGGGSLPAPPLRVHGSASGQCPPRAHGPARLLKAPSASVTHPTALLISEFAKAPFLGVGASQPVNPELCPQVGPAELSHSSAKWNQSRLH